MKVIPFYHAASFGSAQDVTNFPEMGVYIHIHRFTSVLAVVEDSVLVAR